MPEGRESVTLSPPIVVIVNEPEPPLTKDSHVEAVGNVPVPAPSVKAWFGASDMAYP
jgi:hypothetical protein